MIISKGFVIPRFTIKAGCLKERLFACIQSLSALEAEIGCLRKLGLAFRAFHD